MTRLARSAPRRAIARPWPSTLDAPRVICSTDFPFRKLQIDDSHHQSWRLDAVARKWEVPSHSAAPQSLQPPSAACAIGWSSNVRRHHPICRQLEFPMKVQGACHCGEIRYEAEVDPETV